MMKKRKAKPASLVDKLVLKRLNLMALKTKLAAKIQELDENICNLQEKTILEYQKDPGSVKLRAKLKKELNTLRDLVVERIALSNKKTKVEVKIVELENELNSLEAKSSRPLKDGGRIRNIRAIEERPAKEGIFVRVVAAPTRKQEKENAVGKSNIGSNVYWIPLDELEIVRKIPQ